MLIYSVLDIFIFDIQLIYFLIFQVFFKVGFFLRATALLFMSCLPTSSTSITFPFLLIRLNHIFFLRATC